MWGGGWIWGLGFEEFCTFRATRWPVYFWVAGNYRVGAIDRSLKLLMLWGGQLREFKLAATSERVAG